MKSIAENHITITRKLFNEGIIATRNKNYIKTVTKLAFALILFFIIASIWIISTGENPIYLAGEFAFIIILLFWLVFILPRTGNRKHYKSMCLSSSETPTRTTRFFQDHALVISETGKEVFIPYKDVLELKESKNLWILNCQNNQGILLKKDGFSTGSIETVKKAITQIS